MTPEALAALRAEVDAQPDPAGLASGYVDALADLRGALAEGA